MNDVGGLLLAVALAYGFAALVPLLRFWMRGRAGAFAGWCGLPFVIVCPLVIPSESMALRTLCTFVCGDICFKMTDFFRQWDKLDRGTLLHQYYWFLIPLPVLSVVYPEQKRRLEHPESPWPNVVWLVGGTAGCVVAVLGLGRLSRLDVVRENFAVDHAVMLLMFVLAIESLARAVCGLERLLGFDTRPIVQNAYRARTVFEFWRRFNYRMHDWLYRHIFPLAGGRRAPLRSMLVVFLFSGLFHELAFTVATSRLTGYQLAFFTVQGPAALVSERLGRKARRGSIAARVLAHATTILFLAVTSVLFFEGARRIFPFLYASPSPLP